MAIMWDPPTEPSLLSTTLAEATWRVWLMETLVRSPEPAESTEDRNRAEDRQTTVRQKLDEAA
jgi:hypothetical protein